MELIPIKETPAENKEFIENPDCQETIYMTMDFYKKVGFDPPWICYYAIIDGNIVGSAGIKGKPVNGRVEIAYGTVEKYRRHGVATAICKMLVDICFKADPSVKITARTLPEKNFSTRILQKNNFEFSGAVNDPEDGEVWEWEYRPNKS